MANLTKHWNEGKKWFVFFKNFSGVVEKFELAKIKNSASLQKSSKAICRLPVDNYWRALHSDGFVLLENGEI